MNSNQEIIIKQSILQLKNEKEITEEKIITCVNLFKMLNPINDEETEEVIKELQTRLAIKMDIGFCLHEENHKPWYNNAKKDIIPKYWNRYMDYLIDEDFTPNQIEAIDYATDIILDMLGNPKVDGEFSRKGLVIGDVQSGKTTTYTAIINKAADAGYKIIILLTGTIEKLRQQTQGRLDAGFIGLDSAALLNNRDEIEMGVGIFDGSVRGWSITSTGNDFNAKLANQLNIQLSSVSAPVLLVLKKNKSVLEKLEQWLRLHNTDTADKRISAPMLLIDDEADNASINTKKEEDSPTTINKGIRKLLKLFVKSNYVGFTATPYANIFINPNSNDEMLKDDLFPKHFIYALDTPSTYIGAKNIFGDNAQFNYMLKNNDDCEVFLPLNHKKEFRMNDELPSSLKKAIASFMIANTIRDLRGDTTKHRTMLINVSRFINIQDELSVLVRNYVRQIQREVQNYSKMGNLALKHPHIAYIKDVFDSEFANRLNEEYGVFNWEEIQDRLSDSIISIETRSINGRNASKNLNYDEYKYVGLRLIAVGGFSLSRGLTLEGLCTSYFYRNSRMYDTLMQMGRWFGYRKRYDDVCRIWMSEQSVEWYEYISNASEDLKLQVKRMGELGLTPDQFGLCVRNDISALIVTAINKMRYTEDYSMMISLSGAVVETPYLSSEKKTNDRNYNAICDFMLTLKEKYEKANNKLLNLAIKKHTQYLNVDKEHIIDLLNSYESHLLNYNFNTDALIELIKNYQDDSIDLWDVLIMGGEGNSKEFAGHIINPVLRSFTYDGKSHVLTMTGRNKKIGNINAAKGGITTPVAKQIETEVTKMTGRTSYNERDYFNYGCKRNPLLVVYPVMLKNKPEDLDVSSHNVIFGLSIGIPKIGIETSCQYKFKINRVKWKEIMGVDDDYLEESGEIDE